MGVFATACAVNAAWAARGRQRSAWIALATGVGGWAAGNALWCYVAVGETAPISISSAAELGYVVLPLCALGATVLVPNRNDDLFGVGLLLDGVLVAASLFLALGTLVVGAADRASIPRILLAVITAIYLALVVIALIVVRTTPRGRRLSTVLLTAGFAAIGMAGALHLYENRADHIPDDIVTFGWISGTYFLALSAIVFRMGPDLDARRSHPVLAAVDVAAVPARVGRARRIRRALLAPRARRCVHLRGRYGPLRRHADAAIAGSRPATDGCLTR